MKRTAVTTMIITIILLNLAGCLNSIDPIQPPQPEGQDDPIIDATQTVTLFLPNSDADGFDTKDVLTDGTAEDIVALLVAEGSLPQASVLLSFHQFGKNGVVDMSAPYGQALKQTGTTGEYLLLGSLVNTLLKFYQLDTVTLTIEGEVLETGHNIYDTPLGFYQNY
ncbi:MAG: GerMN domain-containing protein [Peptococcaceae bacterium]|nr:GerMN domain-containing protein [Peptococcaceae bacterium]